MEFGLIFLLLFGHATSAPIEGLPLLNPGGIGGIFEGPHSETIIIGPDGSEITSEQRGGAIIQEDSLAARPIIVAEPEVIVSPQSVAVSTLAPLLQQPTYNTIESRDIIPIVEQAIETDGSNTLTGDLPSPVISSTTAAPIDLGYYNVGANIVSSTGAYDSTTAAPIDLGYSTVGANIISSTAAYDSNLINLGGVEETAPLVQYSSSNGVISGQVPSEYLVAPDAPQSNVQRIQADVAVDGRLAMGGSTALSYKLPQVLGDALSQLYTQSVSNNVDIDDKMEDFSQNEIPYDTPNLSQARYIGPALSRHGVDPLQVSLAEVPLSQVIRLGDVGYYGGRYVRSAKSLDTK